MTVNELAVFDTQTGRAIVLAQGCHNTWTCYENDVGDGLEDKLHSWLQGKDVAASQGRSDTLLKLITEKSPEWRTAIWK